MKNKLIFVIISLFLVFSSFSVVSALDASKAPNYTWPNNTVSTTQNSDNIKLYSYSNNNNIQKKEDDEYYEKYTQVQEGTYFMGINSIERYTFEYDPEYLKVAHRIWTTQYFYAKKEGNTKLIVKRYNIYDRNYWITTYNIHIH